MDTLKCREIGTPTTTGSSEPTPRWTVTFPEPMKYQRQKSGGAEELSPPVWHSARPEEEAIPQWFSTRPDEDFEEAPRLSHRTPRVRRLSFHTLGSHVSWQTLLEFAGDTEEAWSDRKVHRWLGVSEADAAALLRDLKELQLALAEEGSPGSENRGFFAWLFGYGGCVGKRRPEEAKKQLPPPPVEYEELASYSFEELEDLGVLGYGGFGSVNLVKCKVTGQTLALKIVSKGTLVDMQLEHTAQVERDVMRACESPFVLKLAATFNRGDWLYLLLEAAMGGDLYTAYTRKQLFGSELHARFYAACVFCALAHLHDRGITYRDLKMENVVLDDRGYGKLCDFGTSTFQRAGCTTICGTPEYMAPEIINGTGHCRAVDWWALGVLVYELIMAAAPFTSEDPLEVFAQVKAGLGAVPLPSSRTCADLVRSLCRKEEQLRLPMLPGGRARFQGHEWYTRAVFDWPGLERCEMLSPYAPEVSGPADMRNFAAQEQEPPQVVPYVDRGTGWDQGFEDVRGPARLS